MANAIPVGSKKVNPSEAPVKDVERGVRENSLEEVVEVAVDNKFKVPTEIAPGHFRQDH